MAYDRFDPRRGSREEQGRWPERDNRDRWQGRDQGGRDDDRGFFERAGDQIASWFGDDDDDRGDRQRDEMRRREGGFERNQQFGRSFGGGNRDRDRWQDRSRGWGERDRDIGSPRAQEDRGYRPVTGDYSRSEGMFAASGYGSGGPGRPQDNWDRDDHRRTSSADSSGRGQHHDPHYQEWRQRQMSELDRDYDEYRREHQSKFENDFGNWRQRRQSKRQVLGQAREHMEVVGSDNEHVGTIDRIAGDRIILTKSDPEAGGAHHSLTCNEVDRIEGDKLILDCTAEQAKQRWRDESRDRALFEREDQGESGPHMLDRSFSGTYR